MWNEVSSAAPCQFRSMASCGEDEKGDEDQKKKNELSSTKISEGNQTLITDSLDHIHLRFDIHHRQGNLLTRFKKERTTDRHPSPKPTGRMTFRKQEKNVPMLMMIFLMVALMTVQKTQGFSISLQSSPVTAMGATSTRRNISATRRNLYEDEKNRHSMDSVEAAEPLPLSSKFQFITSCFLPPSPFCVTILEKSWSSF